MEKFIEDLDKKDFNILLSHFYINKNIPELNNKNYLKNFLKFKNNNGENYNENDLKKIIDEKKELDNLLIDIENYLTKKFYENNNYNLIVVSDLLNYNNENADSLINLIIKNKLNIIKKDIKSKKISLNSFDDIIKKK